jgi:hypothetical protein
MALTRRGDVVAIPTSVITSKPAICDHLKTGQRSRAQDM